MNEYLYMFGFCFAGCFLAVFLGNYLSNLAFRKYLRVKMAYEIHKMMKDSLNVLLTKEKFEEIFSAINFPNPNYRGKIWKPKPERDRDRERILYRDRKPMREDFEELQPSRSKVRASDIVRDFEDQDTE